MICLDLDNGRRSVLSNRHFLQKQVFKPAEQSPVNGLEKRHGLPSPPIAPFGASCFGYAALDCHQSSRHAYCTVGTPQSSSHARRRGAGYASCRIEASSLSPSDSSTCGAVLRNPPSVSFVQLCGITQIPKLKRHVSQAWTFRARRRHESKRFQVRRTPRPQPENLRTAIMVV